jgi:hypothetical protein
VKVSAKLRLTKRRCTFLDDHGTFSMLMVVNRSAPNLLRMSRLEVTEETSPQSDGESEELDFNVEENNDDSDIQIEVDNEVEKDESEEELEQLVFGDSKGFRSGLKTFTLEQEDAAEVSTGIEGLNDAEVGQAHVVEYIGCGILMLRSSSSQTQAPTR